MQGWAGVAHCQLERHAVAFSKCGLWPVNGRQLQLATTQRAHEDSHYTGGRAKARQFSHLCDGDTCSVMHAAECKSELQLNLHAERVFKYALI